jgi:hypothetical protein
MRHVRVSLFCLLSLCLIALVTGCGSTVSGGSGGGGSTDGTFTLGASPAVTIAQGSSQTFTVTPSSANNFTGSIQVSVSGLPSGVTVSPATATVAVGSSTTFTLTAAADAAVGTTTVKVYGASGTLSTSIPVALTVTASGSTGPSSNGDFTLKATPSTLALAPGASGQVTLSSTAIDGFSGAIAVTVTGLPTGVTVSPSTISVTVNNPLVVTLTAASDAPATATPVLVRFTGTSGTLSHSATVQLTITVVGPTGPDFSITATPETMTVAQGLQSDEVQIGVTGTNGFSGDVTYTVSGLPTGVTVIPSSSTLESGWMEPMVFQATADAPIGSATVTITGTSGVLTHNATVTLTVTAPPPPDFVALTLSPTDLTIKAGSIGTVSVTATATDGFTGTVDVSAENLPKGVTMSPATAALTPGVPQTFTLAAAITAQQATSTVTFLGQVNSASGTADLNLTIAGPANNPLDVTTWHNDMARTGLYASETHLTPTTVSSAKFLKFGVLPTDGAVDAQPLFVSLLKIGTVVHNVLYLATENGTVYALDANTGAQLWKTSALEAGETAADNQGCSELPSKVGITATPVVDRNFGTDGAIFFVAKTKDGDGNYHQRLHALDLMTGAELDGSPTEIAATYPANGGATKTFDPGISVERSALLLSNGTVYLSWGAPCHQTLFDYDGWVMAYNEGTLQQQSVLDVTPNGSGGGIWMSGAGPAGDANGNVFLATSEGTFDTTLHNGAPTNNDYGNGFLKIQSPNGVLNVFDYFEPLNGVPGAANYQDQGSGGVMLTPAIASGQQPIFPAAIGAGKDGNIYLLQSSGNVLGEYNGTSDSNFNTLTGALPNGATSSPAYFNGAFYYGGSSDAIRQFTLTPSGATLASQSASTLGATGATPVISANGTQTAILWALDTSASGGAVLNAYDATNVATQLYSSSAKPSDAIGPTGKFTVPTVANGYVYVGTNGGLAIFGLLP